MMINNLDDGITPKPELSTHSIGSPHSNRKTQIHAIDPIKSIDFSPNQRGGDEGNNLHAMIDLNP